MLQQTLTYYVSGSTAVLQGEGNEFVFNNVSLYVSGSEYETGVSGGFKSTVGTIRIELYSGSILIADFPYDQTNLIINSSSSEFAPSIYNINLKLDVQSETFFNPLYYIKILESSSLSSITETNLSEYIINVPANSSSKYIVEAYTGNNKYNELALYDDTNSLILTSSWIKGSGDVVIEPTGSSFYNINFSTSGSVCCSPTLLSVEGLGYNSLKFTFETGSCGTFDSMSIYSSDDQINFKLLLKRPSYPYIISTGSYPTSASYYRLVQKCDDGIDKYNSEPSNVLSFIPSVIPSIPDYYYVSIVGRCSSGTITRGFDYSPDSGSTAINLGDFDYTTTYQPITSFFIYSGSVLFINPSSCENFGIGYNNPIYGYCSDDVFGYGTVISSNTTIYININQGSFCC